MRKLSSKVAIVTGAASGIGAATAKRLCDDGAIVIATDIQTDQGAKVARKIGAEFAEQDITDAGRWDEIISQTVSRHGRLDILVNNAGITLGQSIEEVDPETWQRGIEILLSGPMIGCQKAIAAMKNNADGASGSIINIASTSAYAALPRDITYTTAKSGLRMMSKSIAVHCAQQGYNIRCNAIVPGATDTAILQNAEAAMPGVKAHVAATSPLDRLGTPEEIAAAVAFLASDECPFMTGAEMLVDGAALAVHPGF